ncbi:MAG: hypothetical protein PHQ23_05895 [Candidatus Wallbacteria bacterium]|nr:hypothetical protein [Candidatus Wallbacteria bacterium]
MRRILTAVCFLVFAASCLSAADTKAAGTRNPKDTVFRIKALVSMMNQSVENVLASNRKIDGLLFKNWTLHTEFETDMAFLLPLFRTAVEAYGNLGNSVKDLRSEIFDPSQFCFHELEISLNTSGTFFAEAYSCLRQGKHKLAPARSAYSASCNEFNTTSSLTNRLADQLEKVTGQVGPVPPPPPVPGHFNVEVRRKHVNPGNHTIISKDSPLGNDIMRKVRRIMNDEMSTLEVIQLKFALNSANGFNFCIVRHNDRKYVLYWWHVLDEILDILPID